METCFDTVWRRRRWFFPSRMSYRHPSDCNKAIDVSKGKNENKTSLAVEKEGILTCFVFQSSIEIASSFDMGCCEISQDFQNILFAILFQESSKFGTLSREV